MTTLHHRWHHLEDIDHSLKSMLLGAFGFLAAVAMFIYLYAMSL